MSHTNSSSSGSGRTQFAQDHRAFIGKVPEFLTKTYDMIGVCESDYNDIMCWTPEGDGFVVKDPARLGSIVIPQYFNHSNISSFYRQLSFYCFSKVASDSILNAEFSDERSDYTAYRHQYFKRGMPHLLRKLRRSTRKRDDSHEAVRLKDLKDDLETFQDELIAAKEYYLKRKFADISTRTETRLKELETCMKVKHHEDKDHTRTYPTQEAPCLQFPGPPTVSPRGRSDDSLAPYMESLPALFKDPPVSAGDAVSYEHYNSEAKSPHNDDDDPVMLSFVLHQFCDVPALMLERNTSCDEFIAAIIKGERRRPEGNFCVNDVTKTTWEKRHVNERIIPSSKQILDRTLSSQSVSSCESCPFCFMEFPPVDTDACNPTVTDAVEDMNHDDPPLRIGNDRLPLHVLRCGHVSDDTCWSNYVTIRNGNTLVCPLCKLDVG